MQTFTKIGLYLVGLIGLILVISFINAFLIAGCWNYLMPKLFNLPKIGYWDGYVMAVLSSCLFKSASTSSK